MKKAWENLTISMETYKLFGDDAVRISDRWFFFSEKGVPDRNNRVEQNNKDDKLLSHVFPFC